MPQISPSGPYAAPSGKRIANGIAAVRMMRCIFNAEEVPAYPSEQTRAIHRQLSSDR